MRRKLSFLVMVAALCITSCNTTKSNDLSKASYGNNNEIKNKDMCTIYDFKAPMSNGEELDFSQFKGKVLLIVNTASKCGFTPQFAGLEKLHEQYKDKGLVVIGFPCNQFAEQDPGSDAEIASFCQINYGVTFQIMKKSDVNGPNANPIFTYLKSKAGFAGFNKDHKLGKIMVKMQTKNDPNYAENPDIKWNFTKFLISKDGSQIIRFEPTTEPEELAEVIEKLL